MRFFIDTANVEDIRKANDGRRSKVMQSIDSRRNQDKYDLNL